MWSIGTVLLILFLWSIPSETKVFRKCDLAKELLKQGVDRTLLSSFICLAEAVSGLETSKVSEYKPIGETTLKTPYKSYGIFQINNKIFCRNDYAGGVCKVRCQDLLSDDIKKSAQCARMIQEMEGFKAWKGWEKACKKDFKRLPALAGCFGQSTISG